MKKKSKLTSQEPSQNEDLLEQYSPLKIGKIIPTTAEKPPNNVFSKFRPKPGECLDYNISETFIKMNVGHQGDTKINVRQTEARYVPVPPEATKPKKKKIKYSHGSPPQWKFIEEIWNEHQDELQIQYKREFKQFAIRRKRTDKLQAEALHNFIQSMVGPEWYQELSPKQLNTVDNLEFCITQDNKEKSIIRTKENIASLGLVPRPNSKHIELALRLCCDTDVEFLLILYQLMNPKRTEYSINDRLLLSAVVHLTMTETLRELHIRIPSPPRLKESVPNSTEQPARKRYKSPYLVPFTFKPKPPKYSGKYVNKHIQYPESIYFSYADALHQDMRFAENYLAVDISGISDPADLEMLEDLRNAQILYNKLPNNTGSINLMIPTIKNVCLDFQNYNESDEAEEEYELPHLAALEDSGEICACPQPSEDFDLDDDCCEFDFFEECDCEEECCCKEKSKLFIKSLCKRCIARRRHKNARHIIIGTKLTESNTLTPIIGGTFEEKECDCLLKYKETLMAVAARNKIKCQKAKYVIGGVALTHLGPIYLISCVTIKSVTIKDVTEEPEEFRGCKKSEITEDDATSSIKLSDEQKGSDCQCKKELDLFLNHKCTCEQCKDAATKTNTTYILQGSKKMNDGATVDIIGGVHDQRCDCLRIYLDRTKKLEEYKSRLEARSRMKSHKTKFAINGVAVTPEGPVYCIGGVRSPVRCVCAEVAEKREKDEAHMKRMAKMPPTGRIKYEIAGVQHGSQENTFIISKALPVEECPCEKLYKTFHEAHGTCLNAFEEYLKRIEEEMDEGKEENKGKEENEEKSLNKLDQVPPEKILVSEAVPSEDVVAETTYYEYTETIITTTTITTTITTTVFEEVVSLTMSEYSGLDKNVTVNVRQSSGESGEGLDEYGPDPTTKRFVILKKIPCNRRKQLAILKVLQLLLFTTDQDTPLDSISNIASPTTESNDTEEENVSVDESSEVQVQENINCETERKRLEKVLRNMAEDGFPLAKLPECHKLPHFRLWMEFRCGRSWSQQDRVFYENFSKFFWRHTKKCYQDVPAPRLDISKSHANTITWRDAKFYRQLIHDKNYQFHRKVKQQIINSAREFFPLTFSYEFPTPTFRDCLFAYLPGKEEDLIVG